MKPYAAFGKLLPPKIVLLIDLASLMFDGFPWKVHRSAKHKKSFARCKLHWKMDERFVVWKK
jgi:hypothetical protein